jgi:hypothetical protein
MVALQILLRNREMVSCRKDLHLDDEPISIVWLETPPATITSIPNGHSFVPEKWARLPRASKHPAPTRPPSSSATTRRFR